MFNEALVWLDGKKTYIGSITAILIPYLVATGVITPELGAVIAGIIGLLTGTGKFISDNAVANNTNLGVSIRNKRLNKLN
jgi:hypothetical protein